MNQEIKVINICHLLSEIFGDAWLVASLEETEQAVNAWIEDNDSCYYARPREQFFVGEAIEQAKALGKSSVVVEDLS